MHCKASHVGTAFVNLHSCLLPHSRCLTRASSSCAERSCRTPISFHLKQEKQGLMFSTRSARAARVLGTFLAGRRRLGRPDVEVVAQRVRARSRRPQRVRNVETVARLARSFRLSRFFQRQTASKAPASLASALASRLSSEHEKHQLNRHNSFTQNT